MAPLTSSLLFGFCAVSIASAFAPNIRNPTRSALNMAVVAPLNRVTGQSQLDPAVIQRYADLPMPANTVLAEYVWVDAEGNTRSKTRTLVASKVCIAENSTWSISLSHIF
jgi:glutamine synthetase